MKTEGMPYNRTSMTAQEEVERVRRLSSFRRLAPFARNQMTWELLLVVYVLPNLHISEAIGKLETRLLSHSSIVRFVQEQISAGNFITSVATKRSAKNLMLSSVLKEELMAFLFGLDSELRGQQQNAEGIHEVSKIENSKILGAILIAHTSASIFKIFPVLVPLSC